MKFASRLVVLAAMAGALAACGPAGSAPTSTSASTSDPAPALAKAGDEKPGAAAQIDENTYQYKALGLTVTAPDGWYVAPSDIMEKMMTAGADLSTSNMEQGTKAAVRSSLQRTASIFTFAAQPPGAPVPYMAAVMGLTEDVGALPGIKRGSDYFFHARKLMEQSAVPTTIADGYTTRQIGGQEFDRMDVQMGDPSRAVSQRYFAARHGNVIFGIIQSYRTDEELATLDKVLDSIKLDW